MQSKDFVLVHKKHILHHILISLIENSKNQLRNNKVESAALTDLPRAFCWILEDLLVVRWMCLWFQS